MTTNETNDKKPAEPVDDQDLHKGAKEEDRKGPKRSRTPGLNEEGLPDDPVAIAQDRIGVNEDKKQEQP